MTWSGKISWDVESAVDQGKLFLEGSCHTPRAIRSTRWKFHGTMNQNFFDDDLYASGRLEVDE